MTVKVSSGELILIHWLSGGWLDDSHFNPPKVESDGSGSFSSHEGRLYNVQIEEEGSCDTYSDAPGVEEDKADDEALIENTEEDDEENYTVTRCNYFQPNRFFIVDHNVKLLRGLIGHILENEVIDKG